MRRTLVGIHLTFLGIAAVVLTTLAATAPAGAAQARSQLQDNQQAARRDARQLLARLRLPPSHITARRTIPAFARSFETTSSPVSRDYASASRWELAGTDPKAIIAYVKKHPPAGSTEDLGSGSSSDTKTGVDSIDVQFSWPDVPGELVSRYLTVTVVTPRQGQSVVVAQSESAWFVPRPAGESVPSAAHAVAITVRLGPPATGPVVKPGGKVQTTTFVIWRPSKVAALVKSFNSLPIVQPSAEPFGCPMILTGSSASQLSLAFMSSRGGGALARAQVFIHRGQSWDDGGGPCDPIDFWIAGKAQTALTSPTFVKQVGKLVGANIS